MTELRAKHSNLVLVSACPHGSQQLYYSTCPIDAMVLPEFYRPVRSNIRAGDQIHVQQIAQATDGTVRVAAFVDTVVVAVNSDGVHLVSKGKPTIVQDSTKKAEKPDLGPEVRYVPDNCKAVHVSGPYFDIIPANGGEALARISGKEAAIAVANGSAPLPAA